MLRSKPSSFWVYQFLTNFREKRMSYLVCVEFNGPQLRFFKLKTFSDVSRFRALGCTSATLVVPRTHALWWLAVVYLARNSELLFSQDSGFGGYLEHGRSGRSALGLLIEPTGIT